MFDSPILTTAGLKLLNQAIAGEQLTFTNIKMGKGDLGDTDTKSLTDLVDVALTLPVSSIRAEDESATVSASFSNKDLTQGFLFKEIGLFAKDPDGGEDILYCYQQAVADTAEYMAPSSYEIVERVLSIIVIIGTAENVSAEINHSLVFITWQELEELFDLSSITTAFFNVFTHVSQGDSMSAAEIEEALATAWNGESSDDPTAMSAEEVQEAIDTEWNGETSADETALSAEEISNIIS